MGLAEYLIDTMQAIARRAAREREPSVVIGTVTGVNPLRVRIGDKYEIDEDYMTIGSLCRRTILKTPTGDVSAHLHEIKASTELAKAGVKGQATENELGHSHDIKIETKTALPEFLAWRGLRVDDKVIVIRFEGGSRHYIMERVGGIINDGSDVANDGTINDPKKEEQR